MTSVIRSGCVALAFGLGVCSMPRESAACSFSGPFQADGMLGASFEDTNVGVVPTNVLFIQFESRLQAEPAQVAFDVESGEPVLATVIDGPPHAPEGWVLLRPTEPLTPGRVYQAGFQTQFEVVDAADTEAPDAPALADASFSFHDGESACAQDSCGDFSTVRLELAGPTGDDMTPPDHMTYAVYVGGSREAAKNAQRPHAYLANPDDLWTFGEDDWEDRDLFVSVSALDFAGNESPRTEPARINAGSSGCALRRTRRLEVFPWFFALVAGAALWRRWPRAKRRRLR